LIIACIPAFNEERTIAKVILRSQRNADRVLVCDDGSEDMTAEISEHLGAEVVKHSRNMGYGASIASLLRRADEIGADVVVTLDADAQHDPDQIPRLVKPIVNGQADVVLGSRFIGKGSEVPGYKSVGIRMITDLSNRLDGADLTDSQSGFRAYSRRALPSVLPAEMGMGASTEILSKAHRAGLRVAEVPISVTYGGRPSTHNPVYHGVDVVFSMAKHASIAHPLIVYGIPGLALMVLGLFLGIRALEAYLTDRVLYIFSALISVGAILFGVVLIAVAVILWVVISLMREPEYRQSGRSLAARAEP